MQPQKTAMSSLSFLDAAYKQETIGEEAFREGDPISPDLIRSLLCDGSYHWLLIEAPSGRDIEKDGVVLGAACFSTDGVSRRNGESMLANQTICIIKLIITLFLLSQSTMCSMTSFKCM